MYRIRKNLNGGISAYSGSKSEGIIVIIFSSLRLLGYTLSEVDFSNLHNLSELLPVLFSIPFFIVGIGLYQKAAKIDKAKNFKKSGGGIIKKVKITSIEHYKTSGNDNSRGFNGYYAEAKEGDIIYCSDAYQIGVKGGTPISVLEELYRSYGYEFDMNETHKQDVLREYDNKVAEKKFEAENGGFFKKLIAKGGLFLRKGQRETIEKGYEPEYREINGKRITVGDVVDVYIDPEDEKNYWMDIDFLFNK